MSAPHDMKSRRMKRRTRCAGSSFGHVLARFKELASEIQGILEQIVDVPVPKVTEDIIQFACVWEKILDVTQLVLQERVEEQTVALVPQIKEEGVDVMHLIPQDYFQTRTLEEIVGVPVNTEEGVGAVQFLPQERVIRTCEQDVVVPQIMQDSVDVQFIPQERVTRTNEHIVGVPVRQITEVFKDLRMKRVFLANTHGFEAVHGEGQHSGDAGLPWSRCGFENQRSWRRCDGARTSDPGADRRRWCARTVDRSRISRGSGCGADLGSRLGSARTSEL